MTFARTQYERYRQLICEFAKFAIIGIVGVFITNAVYDLLFINLGTGPVTSATIATIVAAIATYLGNRYWSFRTRQRTGVVREIVIFAVLNGVGLLIGDATVAFNYYLLHLGHNKLAGIIALNSGIALATLFRFWSYRRFVWVTSPANRAGAPEPHHVQRTVPRRQRPVQIARAHTSTPEDGRARAQTSRSLEMGG